MRQVRATIRMILFAALTFGVYSIWIAGSIFIPNKQFWRQSAFRLWARGFRSIAGMKIVVGGNPPRAPFLLVANHLSYIDIVAFRAIIETVFVAKKEIRHWFVAGKIISDMGTIFIDRNNRRDIPRTGKKIIEKLTEGEGVVLFPEGTSSKGEKVLTFNSSILEFAAAAELSVSYAALTYETLTRDPPASVAVCWWDDTPFIVHLWRFFELDECKAIINFGEETVKNTERKKLANDLQQRVSERFLPVF